MAKKSTKSEIDHRIDVITRMLMNAGTTSQILRYCSVEWGVGKRQAETYLARARDQVKQDYSLDRAEFLASRLGVLDSITQKAIKANQLSAAVGSVRLAAELARLLDK